MVVRTCVGMHGAEDCGILPYRPSRCNRLQDSAREQPGFALHDKSRSLGVPGGVLIQRLLDARDGWEQNGAICGVEWRLALFLVHGVLKCQPCAVTLSWPKSSVAIPRDGVFPSRKHLPKTIMQAIVESNIHAKPFV
jgi:hypothetical protein